MRFKNIQSIPASELTIDQWREYRRRGIGGSDAAAIMGLNSWSSPYAVWADKTGRIPPVEENEAMRLGHYLEPYIANRFTQVTGKKVRRCNAILRNPTYPFAIANIDREVMGEDAGLECKSTGSLHVKSFKNGDYPTHYYVQCVHYMAVTGAAKWYLAVLVGNKEILIYEILRDESEISALMQAEEYFWEEYVKKDTPPPVDGFKATMDAIQTIYAESTGGQIELFGRDELLREYYEQKAFKDAADAKMEEIKQTIMLDLGENDTGFCGPYKVTWKPQSRRTFDAKGFAGDHPDMDIDDYYKTTTFRKFDIREVK